MKAKPHLPSLSGRAIPRSFKRESTVWVLKGIRLHDARHSHASLMLKKGIHPKVVQERLGHASIQITLDTYSHVSPGIQQAAAERFDERFAPRPAARVEKVMVGSAG